MQGKMRPKFMNLFILGTKMSITAKVSILHRISGFLMVLSIPGLIYVLNKSLTSTSFYDVFYSCMSNPVIKIFYILFIWLFIYHAVSGVRFLFLDISCGVEVKKAQFTAKLVVAISVVLTIIMGYIIW